MHFIAWRALKRKECTIKAKLRYNLCTKFNYWQLQLFKNYISHDAQPSSSPGLHNGSWKAACQNSVKHSVPWLLEEWFGKLPLHVMSAGYCALFHKLGPAVYFSLWKWQFHYRIHAKLQPAGHEESLMDLCMEEIQRMAYLKCTHCNQLANPKKNIKLPTVYIITFAREHKKWAEWVPSYFFVYSLKDHTKCFVFASLHFISHTFFVFEVFGAFWGFVIYEIWIIAYNFLVNI